MQMSLNQGLFTDARLLRMLLKWVMFVHVPPHKISIPAEVPVTPEREATDQGSKEIDRQ